MTKEYRKELIFVNSFRGSGIGDFGWKLKEEFAKHLHTRYLEIKPSWSGLIFLWKQLGHKNFNVVFNVGFTSFGKSIYKNFLNFLIIGFFSVVHIRPSVILHDSIDTSDLETTGYSDSFLMPIGGMLATKMLKYCNIFVFSLRYRDILEKKYGFNSVRYYPFPCEKSEILECYNKNGNPLLLSVGYVSPYKGLDILPEIRQRLNGIETMIVGSFYKSLLLTKNGAKFKAKFVKMAKRGGITMPGYIDDTRLMELVKEHCTIAVLPYISGHNASYSAIFFVTLGIPVVATDIDVFSESRDNGAGIILVNRNAESFALEISRLITSPNIIENLVNLDRKYCEQYSMNNFCNFVLSVIKDTK